MRGSMQEKGVASVLGALVLLAASIAHGQDYVGTITAAPGHTMYFPQFIAVDEANGSNIVYSNYTVGSFDVYTSTGSFVRSITGAFNAPLGVAIDTANGNNVVGVVAGLGVVVFQPDGTPVTSFIPSGANASTGFYGVAVDTANGSNIVVADKDNDRVEVFTSTGTFVRSFTGSGADALSSPRDVAVDLANGSDVLVADYNNNRVQVFTANGVYVRTIGASILFAPSSVKVDSANNSNVGGGDNSARVFVFTATGTLLRIIDPPTGAGGDDTALSTVIGIAIDTANQSNILVADAFNNRIQVYTDLPETPAEALAEAIAAALGSGPELEAFLAQAANISSAPNVHAKAGSLRAFINHVNAQRGKALTSAEADELIALAEAI